jgi:4-amino-4-deoxy-L-arabinose transferase-like glycosyltransferase
MTRIWIITVIGLAARMFWIGHEPIWRDEAFTAIVAERDVPGMLQAIRLDSAPPLSYLLTHVFVLIFGPTPEALRIAPAILGAMLVPIVAALTRRCAGDRAAVIAAIICALAPAPVMAGRDARMYAMATTLVAASTLALWRAFENPTRVRWGIYGAILLLAVYTQYFALLVIPAQLIGLRFVLRASWRTVVSAAAASTLVAIALVPWLVYAAPQFRHAEVPFWVSPISPIVIAGTVTQFLAGPPIEPGTPGRLDLQALQAVAVIGGLVAIGLLIWFRRLLTRPFWFLLLSAAIPIGALVAVSVWHPLLEARYASVVWGVLFGLLAVGVAALQRLRTQALLLVAMILPTAGFSLAITHPDTPALVSYLEPRLQQNDFVWSSAADYLLLYYTGDQAVRQHTHVVAHHIAWFWGTAAFPDDAIVPAFPETTLQSAGTIYYVDDAGHTLPRPPTPYGLSHYGCFGTICLATYTASSP